MCVVQQSVVMDTQENSFFFTAKCKYDKLLDRNKPEK